MVFDTLFLIRIKNVDLTTGLTLVSSLSKRFKINLILIRGVRGAFLEVPHWEPTARAVGGF